MDGFYHHKAKLHSRQYASEEQNSHASDLTQTSGFGYMLTPCEVYVGNPFTFYKIRAQSNLQDKGLI
jgi:hypothetical protein